MTNHFGGEEPDASVAQRTTAEARDGAVEALKYVERGERNSLDRLRDAMCTYLSALKAEGISRDDALERIRSLIATPASGDPTWLLPAAREALMDLAMHWCTEEYLRE
jgi:hypothetical protein